MGIAVKNLLIATHNPGKIAELKQLLEPLSIGMLSLTDFPGVTDVEETGATFAENARLKAREYARRTGQTALADDSGLEVTALDYRPGVLSARYGGDDAPFSEKIQMLLGELATSNDHERRARFVCSIAISDHRGEIVFTSEGTCEGTIAQEPYGLGGFGYDPIFIPDSFDQTFGELSAGIKNQISHRAKAFREIIPFLRDYNEI